MPYTFSPPPTIPDAHTLISNTYRSYLQVQHPMQCNIHIPPIIQLLPHTYSPLSASFCALFHSLLNLSFCFSSALLFFSYSAAFAS